MHCIGKSWRDCSSRQTAGLGLFHTIYKAAWCWQSINLYIKHENRSADWSLCDQIVACKNTTQLETVWEVITTVLLMLKAWALLNESSAARALRNQNVRPVGSNHYFVLHKMPCADNWQNGRLISGQTIIEQWCDVTSAPLCASSIVAALASPTRSHLRWSFNDTAVEEKSLNCWNYCVVSSPCSKPLQVASVIGQCISQHQHRPPNPLIRVMNTSAPKWSLVQSTTDDIDLNQVLALVCASRHSSSRTNLQRPLCGFGRPHMCLAAGQNKCKQ